MKLFSFAKDGGEHSVVWGFWIVEIKTILSILLLCFEDGSREAYHSHAFNSVSWVLKGSLKEVMLDGSVLHHRPSIRPIITKRDTFHKVYSSGRTWVFSFRGVWKPMWKEYLPDTKEIVILTHGRKVVNQ